MQICLSVGMSVSLAVASAVAFPVQDTRTKIIALSGNAAPGGGTYRSMTIEPVMNNQGQVAFISNLQGIGSGSPNGMFRWDGNQTVAIGGPGGSPALQFVGVPAINESGQVTFAGSTFPSSSSYVFRGAGGALTEIARTGQTVPGGGTIAYLAIDPQINDLGDVSLGLSFDPTSGITGGLYRGSGGTLTEIARLQRPAPTGGNYSEFNYAFPINIAGQIAFAATTSLPNSGAIFRGDGDSTLKIVQQGDLAPDGDGTFGDMGHQRPTLNDVGEVAFIGQVNPFSGSQYSGVFLGSGEAVTQLVRTGLPTPGGDAIFNSFSNGPVINNAGQTTFGASLFKPENPLEVLRAVYRADKSQVTEVMRGGAIASDGNGRFVDFGNPEMNAKGQVTVMAQLLDTSGGNVDDQALYFYSDASSLVQVARKGQPMLGSTIDYLNFTGGLNHVPSFDDEAMGMNDLGQVAYVFRLADGRSGIAVWQLPEPLSALLLVWAGAAWALKIR
ncbi:DUF7453 family protein [Bythopirellula polymerisocia]|uniref:PEP-CTERM protein-sorting domain-containing protein n=1 Tax=Bythopirellula polymerisocia TaxID=2528003 RepID=A0A5C6D3A6_9BACT|nr:hypothetical protein Pla144_04850 [Bythopirellula polymerisocia]